MNVPPNKYTSKENLAKVIKRSETLSMYFPDDPVTQCDRQFVLDVINTLDPNFFSSVMHEYDMHQMSRAKEENKVIEIDAGFYEILNTFENNFSSRTAKATPQRFHLPIKKRKRPAFRASMPEL